MAIIQKKKLAKFGDKKVKKNLKNPAIYINFFGNNVDLLSKYGDSRTFCSFWVGSTLQGLETVSCSP
jgi:hypothetical protein